MKDFNIFRTVNGFIMGKTYKILIYFVIIIILGYSYLKVNDITFDGVNENINRIKGEITKKRREFGINDEINAQKMEKKISQIRRDRENERKRKEEELKQEIIKKEIVPESQENGFPIEKEEQIINPASPFSKLKKLNAIYEDRLAKKQINYKSRIRANDFVYYSFSLNNVIAYRDENRRERTRIVEGDSARIFIDMRQKNNKIFRLLLNKKVGDEITVSAKEVINDIDEKQKKTINKGINDALAQGDPKLRGFNLDIDKSQYRIKILDIIPKKVIKELELD